MVLSADKIPYLVPGTWYLEDSGEHSGESTGVSGGGAVTLITTYYSRCKLILSVHTRLDCLSISLTGG